MRKTLAVLAVVASAGGAPPADGAVLHASPGSLAQILASAKSGDTIVLEAGRYAAPVKLGGGISLDGRGATLEAETSVSPALTLEGANVVRDLEVRAVGEAGVGVRVIRGPVTFERVRIGGFRRYGIRAGGGDGAFLEGSIERCGEDGLSAAGGKWTVKSSRFLNNGDDGVDLFRANNSMIVSSVFENNADAAVELAISQNVRLIGNATRGHRVTSAARLGDLPSQIANCRISDAAYLERRGEAAVTDWQAFVNRTEASNVRIESSETVAPVPVEIQTASRETPQAASQTAGASHEGATFAGNVRARAESNMMYAGLQPSDVSLKTALAPDSYVTPILRKMFEDPFEVGLWLAARAADGESSLAARYRRYTADLGVEGLAAIETTSLTAETVRRFADAVESEWRPVDETYLRSFTAFDEPARRKLQHDLEAQYAEEPDLGLPLVEDFEFEVAVDAELRDLLNRASRVDSGALFESGLRLVSYVQSVEAALRRFKEKLPAKESSRDIVYQGRTPWGPIVIAGTGDQRHDSVVGFFFDLGGHDHYNIPEDSRPCVIVDLAGNDEYIGAAAAGVGRLSALWDADGDDRYEGQSRSQGCGLLGVGFLYDGGGADYYIASRYSQGFGFFGAGWLHDQGGDDIYRVSGYGQAFGGVRGLGILSDAAGNDRYEVLPVNNDSIRDPSRTTSMGQGIGEGLRPQGAGGIGLLWDGGGRDEYLADLFAQGIGYWYALGALVDVGNSNDNYTAYHYVQGAGIHLSVGGLYDDGGADRYLAWYVAQGCGHDISIGALYDANGNDIYAAYGLSQGAGSTNGVGLLCDGAGRDAYMSVARMSGQGDAWYQARLREFGSIGMLYDLGGDDYYASGALNRSVWFKGDHGLGVDE